MSDVIVNGVSGIWAASSGVFTLVAPVDRAQCGVVYTVSWLTKPECSTWVVSEPRKRTMMIKFVKRRIKELKNNFKKTNRCIGRHIGYYY